MGQSPWEAKSSSVPLQSCLSYFSLDLQHQSSLSQIININDVSQECWVKLSSYKDIVSLKYWYIFTSHNSIRSQNTSHFAFLLCPTLTLSQLSTYYLPTWLIKPTKQPQLTTWNKILLVKFIVHLLGKKFPTLYGPNFITVFRKAILLCLLQRGYI